MTDDNMFNSKEIRKRLRFHLHVVSVALAIVIMCGYMARAYAETMQEHRVIYHAIGRGVGYCIGALLFAYGCGWVAHFISGRSNLVGNLVFCVALMLPNCAALGQHPG